MLRRRPQSGTQHALRYGELEASIASVGASLRGLVARGRDLVVPFRADEVRPAYRGATLAPWPNRVVDGRYRFGGVERQLALTEPDRGHALHGLCAWADWAEVDRDDASVRLALQLEPQLSYPWRLEIETEFALSADGLTQTVTATNLSDHAAPWGTGPHPYLRAGESPLEEWSLALTASSVLLVTDDRLEPTELVSVEHDRARFDFRSLRVLGAVEIDHAFTDLEREGGMASARLMDLRSGTGVEIAWDEACRWVQVHTADLPAGRSDPGHRAGLAVEPMTCSPDAFNDDRYDFATGLIVLEPGASRRASWTIRPAGA